MYTHTFSFFFFPLSLSFFKAKETRRKWDSMWWPYSINWIFLSFGAFWHKPYCYLFNKTKENEWIRRNFFNWIVFCFFFFLEKFHKRMHAREWVEKGKEKIRKNILFLNLVDAPCLLLSLLPFFSINKNIVCLFFCFLYTNKKILNKSKCGERRRGRKGERERKRRPFRGTVFLLQESP